MRNAVLEGLGCIRVISYWEVMVKRMKGKLDVGDPRRWWSDTLEELKLLPLVYRPEHVDQIGNLAKHHADPFDRALVATAMAENLTMLTLDKGLGLYAGDRFRLIH